jgi:hypothetical protein
LNNSFGPFQAFFREEKDKALYADLSVRSAECDLVSVTEIFVDFHEILFRSFFLEKSCRASAGFMEISSVTAIPYLKA